MVPARVHRYISEDMLVRIAAVDATQVVEEMRALQKTMPLSTVAAGRAMVGAILMASHLDEDQEVALDFQVNGPIQRLFAHATHQGGVRAYVAEPGVSVEEGSASLSINKAMGIGLLTVSSFLPHHREPHRGMVHLVSGEIGEDLAHYYDQSYQVPVLISLGVHLDEFGKVDAAGGILLELMPGAPASLIENLERNQSTVEGISTSLLKGITIPEMVQKLVGEMHLRELPHPYELSYSCPCSLERVLRSMSLLGVDEIQTAISTNETISSQCQMCGKWYHIVTDDLVGLLARMTKNEIH